MAKLLRLQISGIRNFGPNDEDAAKIKFSSPLTLFLGQNGCGKTTIIESLKFACTGDLPGGSSSGQGFIHDPKINSTVVSKGQVRLKILDQQGNEVTVFKSAQVKQVRDKLQFSSIDNTLSIKKPSGDVEQLSTRCLDVSSQFCQKMGASKAILNYVIFCHQEDSLWPLEEGKSLKEKFDKIFDVDNYNKCIDQIRLLIKKKDVDIKLFKQDLCHKRDMKELVERDRAKLKAKEEKLNEMRTDIDTKKNAMDPVDKRLNEILALENKMSSLDREIVEIKTNVKFLLEKQNAIKDLIETEFIGSDEDLSRAIEVFQKKVESNKIECQNILKQKDEIAQKKNNIQNSISKIQILVGKLNEAQEQHKKKILERNNLLKDACKYYDIDIFSNSITHEDSVNVISTLQAKLNESKQNISELIEDCKANEEILQKTIDKLRENKVKLQECKQFKDEQIQSNKKKIFSIANQLNELDSNLLELRSFKNKLKNIEDELEAKRSSFDYSKAEEKVEREKLEIQALDTQLETSERDLKLLQRNDTLEYDIEQKQETVAKKQLEIDRLQSKHAETFNLLFSNTIHKDLTNELDLKKNDSNLLIENLNKKIDLKQRSLTKLETEYKMLCDKLQSMKIKLKNDEKKINEVCRGQKYDILSKTLYEDIEKLQRDKGQYRSAKVMYEKFIKDFQKESPCCPVCETSFNGKQSVVANIISTIKEKIQGIPTELKKLENDLTKKQEWYNNVLQLGTVNEGVHELIDVQMPIVMDEIEKSKEDIAGEKTSLQKLQEEITYPQKTLDACKAITVDAVIISQNSIEIDRLKRVIDSQKTELVKIPSNKTKLQLENHIETIKSNLLNLRRNIDNETKKMKQFKDDEHNLKEQKSKIFQKQLKLEQTMQGKSQLEEQVQEMREMVSKLQNEVIEIGREINEVNNNLLEAERNKLSTQEKNNALIESKRKSFVDINTKIKDIIKLQHTIETEDSQSIQKQITEAAKNLTENKAKFDRLSNDEKKYEEELNDIKMLAQNKESEFKKLKENITLRKLHKEELKLKSQLKELESQRGNYDNKTLFDEKKRLESELTKLHNSVLTLKGQNTQLEVEIDELTQKLNRSENVNAYKLYKSKLFELKIAEQVKEDLMLYSRVLETSIMQFHSDRMKQVNRIIREYWRQIYRGNDIDYIEIKNEKSMTGTEKKRIYNYRVVQMKNGIELDMRGRCSAGQKVLACLIIRMALAETFSHSCGILALDEPTTNLDRENIISLSEALARIVNARQSEKNFQLLVITHDAEFLNALTHVDKINYYYKVSRNEDGNSVITQESL